MGLQPNGCAAGLDAEHGRRPERSGFVSPAVYTLLWISHQLVRGPGEVALSTILRGERILPLQCKLGLRRFASVGDQASYRRPWFFGCLYLVEDDRLSRQ